MARMFDKTVMKTIAIACWAIWYAMNKIVHEGIRQTALELIVFIKAYLSELEANDQIKTKANAAVHALATKGSQLDEPRYWVEEAPQVVERVVEIDRQHWFSRK
ncbi:hypothetical protein GOBAR_DD00124 [Gossypium barbadense]|nr:hypothetical protein GOBAR_DD00124 [Gossypium barbadense]